MIRKRKHQLVGNKTEQEIVDIVLQECKELDSILNNVILKKFAEIHNIKPEHSMFQLKQEVVAKNSIFMDVKKRYALYIINNEGKPCSRYEIKGMITQRSEYPPFTKEKITELLDLIIKNDQIDFKIINDFCERTRMEILERCQNHDKSIAGMGSMRSDIDSYDKKPFQVLAMELWNKLEYEYFVPGTKGCIFRINGIDIDKAPRKMHNKIHLINHKNKYIAIPFEVDKLPDYYIMDTMAQVKYAWDDRESEVMRVLRGDTNAEAQTIFDRFESQEIESGEV